MTAKVGEKTQSAGLTLSKFHASNGEISFAPDMLLSIYKCPQVKTAFLPDLFLFPALSLPF